MELYKQYWNSMIKVITQIYYGPSLKYHSNDCNQLLLVFVPDPLQQKQLDGTCEQ